MTTSDSNERSAPRNSDDGGWTSTFVRRPILAWVLNLLIIIAGISALQSVKIRELPDVDCPVVTVRVSYPGATPDSMDTQVAAIIESAVSRVEGVTSISSRSRYGDTRITVELSDTTDLDQASIDVRDAVARIRSQLSDGLDEEPRVEKADSDASPIMRLAVASRTLNETELTDLVEDVIEDRLSAVEGVAAASSYGLYKRIVEVRAYPVALAARGLSLEDLRSVIGTATITTPSGDLENSTQQLLVRAEVPVTTPEDVSALEINPQTKVEDVAFVRWGHEEKTDETRFNGKTAVGMEIIRQAQSNTIDISDGVQAAVEQLNRSLPQGVEVVITSDDAIFIRESIKEVVTSILLATSIVVLIIMLFLRSFRATLAPAIAIPVSLIGTIAAIWLAGFSINLLTLLALVVATGLVVDDAIVVLENIARHRAMGMGPRAAAVLGTKQIVFAVLATTATLAAVFVPISFMPGIVGRLFSEFGFVLAFAVSISSFVALVLCPMLASRLGTGNVTSETETAEDTPSRKGILAGIGAGLITLYRVLLDVCLKLRYLVILAAVGFGALGYTAYRTLPQEITPTKDRGVILARVSAQQGAGLAYMSKTISKVEAIFDELKERGEVKDVLALIGRGSTNRAFMVAPLAPWSERQRSQQEIQAELQRKLAKIPGLQIRLFSPNSLGIRGGGQGLRFAVAGPNYDRIANAANELSAKLMKTPGFRFARTDFDTTQPQLSVTVNREAATKLGVPITTITSLINTMVDYNKAAELFIDDDIVKVQIKAGGRPINDSSDLENLFVKTADGTFVTLSTLVSMKEVAIAPSLEREDRRRAINVSAQLDERVAMGDAVEKMREVAAGVLERGMSIILLGEARTLSETTGQTTFVFGIALLIVFLVLAAQFESIISALIILTTVPFGLAATAFAIQLTGGTLNVYSQIGLVLLVGVMAKNGILIVEFANQLRDEGKSVHDAVRTAAIMRLRPVMMTMASTVLGALPLVFASGAGAESRMALGWVIIGGLGFATIFTLFLTPVAFRILAPLSKPRADEAKRLMGELTSARGLPAGVTQAT